MNELQAIQRQIVQMQRTINGLVQVLNAQSGSLNRHRVILAEVEQFLVGDVCGELPNDRSCDLRCTWAARMTIHDSDAAVASYAETALVEWSSTNQAAEVRGHVLELPDGRWMLIVSLHPESPLRRVTSMVGDVESVTWDWATRLGDDKGDLIRSVVAKLRAEKSRIEYPNEIVNRHIGKADDGRRRVLAP
jgi:hypothetical protein